MVSMFAFIFSRLTRGEAKIACFDQGESQVLRKDKTQVVEEPIPAQLVWRPVPENTVVVQAVHSTTQQMGGTTDRRSFRRAKRALYFLKIWKYMSVGALCGILIAMGLVSCETLPFLIMGSGVCVYMWVIAQKTSEDIQRFVQ